MTGTPFLYWVVNLFSTGDYETDLNLWYAMILGAFVFGVLMMCRLLGFSAVASLVILLPMLHWFEPLHSDIRVANVNSIQLGMVAVALWLYNRDSDLRFLIAAGVFVALIVMFKPNLVPVPILLIGAWLIREQWRKLAVSVGAMFGGGVLAFAVSTHFIGSLTAWFDWLTGLFGTTKTKIKTESGNYSSLDQMDMRLDPAGQVVFTLALCVLVLVFFWLGKSKTTAAARTTPEQKNPIKLIEYSLLFGLGSLIHMLTSSLVWEHYYVLAIPMLIVAFRPWHNHSGGIVLLLHRFLGVIALVCLMAGPFQALFDIDSVRYFTAVNFIAVISLFSLGLWQLRIRQLWLPQSI
jgi:hypothetical protein